MKPEMYEEFLQEQRMYVEDEIKKIATDGNYTEKDIEKLERLIAYLKILPVKNRYPDFKED